MMFIRFPCQLFLVCNIRGLKMDGVQKIFRKQVWVTQACCKNSSSALNGRYTVGTDMCYFLWNMEDDI